MLISHGGRADEARVSEVGGRGKERFVTEETRICHCAVPPVLRLQLWTGKTRLFSNMRNITFHANLIADSNSQTSKE